MNPEDDPEARIRALEQPLADSARSSELGGPQPGGYSSNPYPPPAPPPPPLYGDYNAGGYNSGFGPGYSAPFPGATPRRSSGNRVFWILAAVFVVGMLAVVGGIAAYVAHRISSSNVIVEPSTPNTSVFSSPRSAPRSPTPSTSRSRTPTAGPSTPAPGSNISIAGINENKTIACNDNSVTVSGVSNTITISGHCTKLTVSGMQNSVTVDAVDTIDASGLNNQVTYHSGSPQISKSGEGNDVQQG
jgi:cytoskeletal protein RodZ